MSDRASDFEKYHTADGHWFMGVPFLVRDIREMSEGPVGAAGLEQLLSLLEKRVLLSSSDYGVSFFDDLTLPQVLGMVDALLYARPVLKRCSDLSCVCYSPHHVFRERVK